ncbi:MAG TPA: bifunctional D-glycero-beta-D-manno-heptose-7-phosphate kinase/D-glycero-beta-D-manno-heptose 1-phosphate adenylyltransferase HldE [Gammaproteobacteria bacterium]|nr:bifunctional D-glycero-beta-D-manno-heptose-7-phosphate kinase/D-glycero-beta-D-manno-heptose 1-phosphate adenylyltransferase HldE [Gammaproteobacteria bacterium]
MSLAIPDFSGRRVLIAGDIMLDRYWQGATRRISPEAPVPIVRVDQTQERPGGAGNVAMNIVALGANCTVLGITGDDEAAASLETALQTAGITSRLLRAPDTSTITKLRVISRHQQLLRLDFEDAPANFSTLDLQIPFKEQLDHHDIVILSDYAKGSLHAVAELIKLARTAGKPVLVDPKGHDFKRYRGATLLTPNRTEFEAVVGECDTEAQLLEKGERLRRELALDGLLLTRSEQGMTLFTAKEHLTLPAQARDVFDVTGAGDTVIALLAAALAAGETMPAAARLANLAASLVVGKLGAGNVTPAELELAAHTGAGRGGIIDKPGVLQNAVKQARAQGERVVMTNGCFDILHAGHVAYLQAARALGDRLIVAVNDDASVQRLKGKGRPVNTLAARMAVLAALDAVDWVIPFAEDTPADLINRILPNVLVKGGDYKAEQIAGADSVLKNGGEVKTLNFIEGHSTTGMIEAIKKQ